MTVKSAKTKIIPLVVLFNLAYNSYTVFWLVEADPGILACNSHSGTSVLVGVTIVHFSYNLSFPRFFLSGLANLPKYR